MMRAMIFQYLANQEDKAWVGEKCLGNRQTFSLYYKQYNLQFIFSVCVFVKVHEAGNTTHTVVSY